MTCSTYQTLLDASRRYNTAADREADAEEAVLDTKGLSAPSLTRTLRLCTEARHKASEYLGSCERDLRRSCEDCNAAHHCPGFAAQ